MDQKIAQQQRLIEERVRALAIVSLTRRLDVQIRELVDDRTFDLLVTLHPEGKHGLRQFTVQAMGTWKNVTAKHASSILRPGMQKFLRAGPFPFPVVLFLFTMENTEGWYTWVTEPVVSQDGDFELRAHGDADCQPLNDPAVDEIIARVDRWYDVFFARTGVATSKHGKSS